MKSYISLFCFYIGLSCSGPSVGDQLGGKVPLGNYVMKTQGEFSNINDTITIEAIDQIRNLYSLQRNSGYEMLTGTGKDKKQYKQETMVAIWDAKTGQLKEQKYGRTYILSASGDELIIGNSIYSKLK